MSWLRWAVYIYLSIDLSTYLPFCLAIYLLSNSNSKYNVRIYI